MGSDEDTVAEAATTEAATTEAAPTPIRKHCPEKELPGPDIVLAGGA